MKSSIRRQRLPGVRGYAILILGATAAWADDPLEIVRRSVERDQTNFERSRNYTYLKRAEERELDARGKVKKTVSETHEIIFLAGQSYQRLIARNDRPLAEKDARKEEEKMDKELRRRQREPEKTRKQLEKDRAETRRFVRDIPEAFDFRLLGEERVSGEDAWVIEAEPKPGYQPSASRAKMLRKIRARLWIGKADYHWVKLDAEAIDTISFGGFLIRVGSGAQLRFEQARVNEEVWLPRLLEIEAQARVALVKKMRRGIRVTYSDYRKFQADSRILNTEVQ